MVKTYLLKNIPDETWFNFKAKLSKNDDLNRAIISLIEQSATGGTQ